MPTTFEDRERGFEAKFAHDEEFRFVVLARRDKLFAHWAANKMSLDDVQSDVLVKQALAIRNGPDHDEGLLRQIGDALAARGVRVSAADLSVALAQSMEQAMRELTAT